MADQHLTWDDLRLFLLVARQRGLAGASRASGTSAATLGRRMARLEQALGGTLFDRHAWGYDLTEGGRRLLERAEALEQQVQAVERETFDTSDVETVRLSAGTWMSLYLARNLPTLRRPSDRFRIALLATETRLDIARREAVIGLRNGPPREHLLAARKLGSLNFAAYAAEDADDGWIGVATDTRSGRWVRARHAGALAVEVSSPRNALDLALLGAGRAVLPCFIGDAEPRLARVGGLIDDLETEQWLVLNDVERRLSAPRLVIDRLVTLVRRDAQSFRG